MTIIVVDGEVKPEALARATFAAFLPNGGPADAELLEKMFPKVESAVVVSDYSDLCQVVFAQLLQVETNETRNEGDKEATPP